MSNASAVHAMSHASDTSGPCCCPSHTRGDCCCSHCPEVAWQRYLHAKVYPASHSSGLWSDMSAFCHHPLQEWQLRLTYLMLETLGALRSEDMFNTVIDYPYSAPALQDLAVCLQHTNMAGQFAATFRASLQQRLLHAGAATSDIIHTYVSTIKAMKEVDQSGRYCLYSCWLLSHA